MKKLIISVIILFLIVPQILFSQESDNLITEFSKSKESAKTKEDYEFYDDLIKNVKELDKLKQERINLDAEIRLTEQFAQITDELINIHKELLAIDVNLQNILRIVISPKASTWSEIIDETNENHSILILIEYTRYLQGICFYQAQILSKGVKTVNADGLTLKAPAYIFMELFDRHALYALEDISSMSFSKYMVTAYIEKINYNYPLIKNKLILNSADKIKNLCLSLIKVLDKGIDMIPALEKK